MTILNRRGLIGAAGASMLLASCKWPFFDPMKPAGVGFPHGDLPNLGGPLNTTVKFAPKWIRVVYMRFDAANMLARQGYVPMPATPNDEEVGKAAIEALRMLKKGEPSYFWGGKITEHADVINLPSQMVLVLYLDNDPKQIRFEKCNGDKYVIRFTPFSGERPEDITKMDIKENHAFFGMRPISMPENDPDLKGPIAIRLDFWNTDKDGNAIKNVKQDDYKSQHRYSMNIHLQQAVAAPTIVTQPAPGSGSCDGYWTPLILDPDTGNMGGEPT